MPAIKTRLTDWTAGEISPTLGGRVDLDRYGHGADRIENMLIAQGGALRRRPGSRHKGTAPSRARLGAFVFSETEAYALEWCEGTVRFYTNAGLVAIAGVPVSVAHPYLTAELPALKWVQSADVQFLVHINHPPARLLRLKADGTLWRYLPITFDVPASFEFGLRGTQVAATVTPSAVSGAVVLTASAPAFLVSDIGRDFEVLAGDSVGARGRITIFTDTTHVTATVAAAEAFVDLAAIPAANWRLSGSPKTTLTPSVKEPVGAASTLTLAANGWRVGDVGKFVHVFGGTYEITGFTSALIVDAIIRSVGTAVTATPDWTLEEAAWSALNGYPSVVAFAEDRLWFFGTRAQPQSGWASKSGDYLNFALGAQADDALAFTLNSSEVNAIRWAVDYGRGLMIGTSGEEWVIDAGETETLTPSSLPQAVKPATAYGSSGIVPPIKAGNVILFATRSRRKVRELAPDPNAITVATYVAPDMTLLADHLTTPVKILSVKQNRRFTDLAWQREPNQTVWAVREDGTLLSFAYIREQNVTGWCRHIFSDFYPDFILALDGDERQFPPLLIGGFVESVCVIPHADGDRDQVWLSVARNSGGSLVRHVEVLEDQGIVFDDGFVLDGAITVDGQVYNQTLTRSADTGTGVTFTTSGLFFDPGMIGSEIRHIGTGARATITGFISPQAVTGDIIEPFTGLGPTIAAGQWGLATFGVGGLSHLEQQQVQIVGDGAVYPLTTVSGANAFLDGPAAMKIEVGVRFSSRLKTLRPEVAGLGTVQGTPKRQARIILRVYKSAGFTLNGTVQPFRRGGDALGTGTLPRSDDFDLANFGWDKSGQIEVEQTNPLPLTLLGIFSTLDVAD